MTANTKSVNVAQHLEGIDFPADRQMLIDHARDQGASVEVLDVLETIPDRNYESIDEVTEEVGKATM